LEKRFSLTRGGYDNPNLIVDATKVWVPFVPDGAKAYVKAVGKVSDQVYYYSGAFELDGETDAGETKLTMYYDGSAVPLTCYAREDSPWHVTFSGLINVNDLQYEIKECDKDGKDLASGQTVFGNYVGTIAGGEIISSDNSGYIITNTSPTVTIPFTKKWSDGSEKHGASDQVTVQLQRFSSASGKWEDVDGRSAVLDGTADTTAASAEDGETGPWQGAFKALPTIDSVTGQMIRYRVRESSELPGYISSVSGNMKDGFTITNTRAATAKLGAVKTLNGEAPGENTFEFELYKGSVAEGTPLQTKKNGTDGSIAFDDLIFKETGEYTYTIHEVNDGQPRIDYDSADVIARIKVSKAENGDLSAQITYEKSGTQTDEAVFRNRTTPVLTQDITVTKKWEEGASGKSAVVQLYRSTDGTKAEDENSTASSASLPHLSLDGSPDADFTDDDSVQTGETSAWVGVFKNLPKTDDSGQVYTYSIREVTLDSEDSVQETENYTVAISGDSDSGFTVTNTPSDEEVNVPVEKRWEDGAKGDKVVVALVKDGKVTDTTVTITADDSWKSSFEGLPRYAADGHEIDYGVRELTKGYAASVSGNMQDGFVITNRPLDKNTGGVTSSGGSSVNTGDSSQPLLWLAVLAAAAIAAICTRTRKRGNNS
jgi:pilin isopeptide linkage protein